MPHEEDPTMFDAITIALSLKQVFFVTAQYGIVRKYPSNSNSVQKGAQQATPATPAQETLALQAWNGTSNFFKKLFPVYQGS